MILNEQDVKMAQAILDQLAMMKKDSVESGAVMENEVITNSTKCGNKRRSKRKASEETKSVTMNEKSDEKPIETIITTPDKPTSQGKCIWCLKVKTLLPKKKFCEECNNQGCECAYCHRPMPERFFKFSKRLCNACFKKSEKQKAKRKLQRKRFSDFSGRSRTQLADKH